MKKKPKYIELGMKKRGKYGYICKKVRHNCLQRRLKRWKESNLPTNNKVIRKVEYYIAKKKSTFFYKLIGWNWFDNKKQGC